MATRLNRLGRRYGARVALALGLMTEFLSTANGSPTMVPPTRP